VPRNQRHNAAIGRHLVDLQHLMAFLSAATMPLKHDPSKGPKVPAFSSHRKPTPNRNPDSRYQTQLDCARVVGT
jgi:hypothetical protein